MRALVLERAKQGFGHGVVPSIGLSAHGAPHAIPVEDGEISPPDALDDLPPDEEDFHEATGNECASFERGYRGAALVLWPRARFFAVLNTAGPEIALPYLADLAGRWEASGEGRDDILWRQVDTLAAQILAGWPTTPWSHWGNKEPSDAARLLGALIALGNTGRIEETLAKLAAQGGYAKADNSVILDRLVHNAYRIDLAGDSLRRQAAEGFWTSCCRTRMTTSTVKNMPCLPLDTAPTLIIGRHMSAFWKWLPTCATGPMSLRTLLNTFTHGRRTTRRGKTWPYVGLRLCSALSTPR